MYNSSDSLKPILPLPS